MDGKTKKWKDAKIHLITHTLHYGAGVFEGIRIYKTSDGSAIFRLKEHIKRLFFSAKSIGMKLPYTQKKIIDATLKLVKKNKLKEGYIRHLVIYGYGKMGVNPVGAPVSVSISMWGWGSYLGEHAISVKTSKYIRIHPESTVTAAKIVGHYSNSILASLEATNAGYDEALFLDHKGNVAEGAAENVYVVKKGVIYTPPAYGILSGLTRDTIKHVTKDLGIKFVEKTLKLKDVYSADEVFFTGTAAEVTPISKVDKKRIGNGKNYPIAAKLKKNFLDIARGKNLKYKRWLTYLN